MALVTEDGTGLADAESYASVAAYKAHCDGRGISYAGLTDTDIEVRLRKGTDYMEEAYRERWGGVRQTSTQALSWPRYAVPMRDAPGSYGPLGYAYWPSDEVPAAVARACIVLAIKSGDGDLNPDLTQAVKRKKVGPVEIEYQDTTDAAKTYPQVDAMLTPFLANPGGVRIVRA